MNIAIKRTARLFEAVVGTIIGLLLGTCLALGATLLGVMLETAIEGL